MSNAIFSLIRHARAHDGDKPCSFPGDMIRPVRTYLINLNFDEEQENFFIELMKIDKDTNQCEIPALYLPHLIEFLQGVPQ